MSDAELQQLLREVREESARLDAEEQERVRQLENLAWIAEQVKRTEIQRRTYAVAL